MEDIINRLVQRKQAPNMDGFKRHDCLFLYETLADNEIEPDHIFLSYEKAKQYNEAYHKDFTEFKESHWIFAEGGSGDFWIIDLNDVQSPPTVLFYDHDLADFSPENMFSLSINIFEWLQMASIIAQFHEGLEAEKVVATLENIKKGLTEKIPFDFFE